jgi:hypothetical protein
MQTVPSLKRLHKAIMQNSLYKEVKNRYVHLISSLTKIFQQVNVKHLPNLENYIFHGTIISQFLSKNHPEKAVCSMEAAAGGFLGREAQGCFPAAETII